MKKTTTKKSSTKKSTKKTKTIPFAELKRLSFCNSAKLPKVVNVGGRRKEWVGIGWTDQGEADGTEVKVVE